MAKLIHTSILINASSEKIWKVLTDFKNYPNWNPFIKQIVGKKAIGSLLHVQVDTMKFTPRVIAFEKEKQFSWKGKPFIPYLFDGEHSFSLVHESNGSVKFIHQEKFTGILPFFLGKKFFQSIEKGFIKKILSPFTSHNVS